MLWARFAIFGVLAMVVTASCTAAQPGAGVPAAATVATGTPVRGGTLTIGVVQEAGTLDIQTLTNATTRNYARALYNSLTNVDLAGNVVPELAESWSSPD